MNHPGIAQIFHVGETEQGRPYFVMEYIDGEAITRYCDDERLGIEERLELFAVVCRAVEHAHQRGIIHRDIKPSNVLVKERDGEPAPVVIDFGLAKAIEEGAEGSELTLQGQLVGTPTYMSPEQIVTAPEGLDARTDVYSLGVLLYELIVGVPPFTRSPHESLPAFLNRVREERFPPPGLRFRHASAEGEELARRRGTSVAGMRRWLRGGLERIMAKAVEKDRDGRYSSAAELAGDVALYLRGEPILASPSGPAHRLQHFVGRHRWSVGVFVTLLVAWFAASAASTLWYLLANRHRDEKAAIVRACDSVQLRIADAHLWFEEALAMDESVRVERDVDQPIREAIELVRATLVGGETEGFGHLEPVGQEDARTALGLMLAELERFEDVTRERWLARDEEGETGGRLDQAYDATYRRILGHSSTASAAIESAMTREWQRAVRLAVAVNLVAMVLLAAPAAVMLRPGVRRRG
jgi:hypothetical protein